MIYLPCEAEQRPAGRGSIPRFFHFSPISDREMSPSASLAPRHHPPTHPVSLTSGSHRFHQINTTLAC